MDKLRGLLRKTLVVGVFVLFIEVGVQPVFAVVQNNSTPISKGNILYVGGSGAGNYSIIQYAVDNSSNGDTVFVYRGLYYHYFPDNLACVKINKSIHLVGEDKNTTIIKGSGIQRVVWIYADEVTVKGFTMKDGGCPDPPRWGVGVDVQHHKKNVTITNNIIMNNQRGIYVEQYSNEVFIYDNIIMNNQYGIDTDLYLNTEIYHNTISNNEHGIHSSNGDVLVHDNYVINNTIGFSFYDVPSSYIIEHNQIKNNNIGIHAFMSKATIQSNNFINNIEHTELIKASIIITLLNMLKYRLKWSSNYWDDWTEDKPKPIRGLIKIYVRILIPLKPFIKEVHILSIPYFEFDRNPVKKPYII